MMTIQVVGLQKIEVEVIIIDRVATGWGSKKSSLNEIPRKKVVQTYKEL